LFHRRRQQQSGARGSEIGGPKKQAAASPLRALLRSGSYTTSPPVSSVVISGRIQHGRPTHSHTPTDDQPFLGDRRKISRQLRYTILWRREKDLDLGVGDACSANELIFAVVVLHKHALRVFM
jgi:hypothetical protein